MHLVNDVDLEAAALRQIYRALPEIPDVLHAVVGSSINFNDVGECTPFCIPADIAGETGIALRRAVLAVDGLGQNSGAGGFAGAP